MNTRPERGAAWLAAAPGAALTLAVFWPGLLSVDSAGQYAQALGLVRLDDVLPPLMTLAWRALDRMVQGSGAMFAVLVLAWWSGLAAVLAPLHARAGAKFTLVLGIGLFPATFVIIGHVWKDVAMGGALLWSCAAIAAARRDPGARWRACALLALALACAMRQNAIFAVLPLLAWLCWPLPASASGDARVASRYVRAWAPWTWLRTSATFVLLAALLAVTPGVLAHALRAQPTQPWTVVALWDLAAVSIATDRMLIPSSVIHGELTLEDLRHAYVPYANPPLFALGKIQLSLYIAYTPEKIAELQRAWFEAMREHPAQYLSHRAALSRYLLFGIPRELPRELVYVPERRVPGDAGWTPPPVDTSTRFWRAVEWLRPTPLFAGATYLAIAALAVLLARRRVQVWALSASSYANALPLLAISGSAEFRYLAWSATAALLALALACIGGRTAIR